MSRLDEITRGRSPAPRRVLVYGTHGVGKSTFAACAPARRERRLTFKEVTRVFPVDGRRLHVSTVHRWRNPGVQGVRLEAVRLGHVWYTSFEAIERFARRLTALGDRPVPSNKPGRNRLTQGRTPAQRKAAQEKAREDLSEAGIWAAREREVLTG